MTPRELEMALEAELGEPDSDDYYTLHGTDAFYHELAGTDPHGYNMGDRKYEIVSKGVINVPTLGVFTRQDMTQEFIGEPSSDTKVVFKYGEQYFRKQAYLDSWDGGLWSEGGRLEEVKPVEKTITVWDRV